MAHMPGAMRPKVAIRVVRADGGPESVIPMHGEQLLCGRSGDLAIPDDPFVAETQMRLFFSGTRLAVEDVGGGNGVFTRLRSEREVGTGGEVRVGRQRLVVEPVPAARPPPRTAPPPGAHPTPATGSAWCSSSRAECAAAPSRSKRATTCSAERTATSPSRPTASSRAGTRCCTSRPTGSILRDLGSLQRHVPPPGRARPSSTTGDQFLIGRQLVRVEMN